MDGMAWQDNAAPLPRMALRVLRIGGCELEYRQIAAHQVGRPELVFLHEALGSAALWRDFPDRVAAATGCRTLVYTRTGLGGSTPLERTPREPDYLHREALEVLPEVLARLAIERPVLIGHSDGASLALIHAGARRWEVAGVVAMAPHVFVEDVTLQGIAQAVRAWETTDLPARLARHHRDAAASFRGWADTWLAPAFRDWNIESCLPGIGCPVLAIQGEDDEYGSMAQLAAIARQAPDVELLALADCRHAPHRDQPAAVLEAVVRFVAALG
jgi:pimeloyl-ACP methyl ester carboxylesterase